MNESIFFGETVSADTLQFSTNLQKQDAPIPSKATILANDGTGTFELVSPPMPLTDGLVLQTDTVASSGTKWDNISVPYCKAVPVNNSMVNTSTTFASFNLFNTVSAITLQSGSFSVGSNIPGNPGNVSDGGGIIVPQDGIYFISASLFFMIPPATSSPRVSVGLRFAISAVNGMQGTALPEQGAMGYIRDAGNNNDESSVTISTITQLSANDQIQIQLAQLANTGSVDLIGSQSILIIHRIAVV